MYILFANNPNVNNLNNVLKMCKNTTCTAVLLNHGTHKRFVMDNFLNVLWYGRFNPFSRKINGMASILFYKKRFNHTYLVSNAYACGTRMKSDDNIQLRKFQNKFNASSIVSEQSMRMLNCVSPTMRSLSTGIISAMHLRQRSKVYFIGFSKWKTNKKACHDYSAEWKLFHNHSRYCPQKMYKSNYVLPKNL